MEEGKPLDKKIYQWKDMTIIESLVVKWIKAFIKYDWKFIMIKQFWKELSK